MSRISPIIKRIKDVSGLRTDADVAKKLGLKPNTLAERKTRDSIPFEEIFRFCVQNEIYLDWLLTGLGPKFKSKQSDIASESQAEYSATQPGSDPYDEKLSDLKRVIETTKKNSEDYNLGLNDTIMASVLDMVCVHHLSDDAIRDLLRLLAAIKDFLSEGPSPEKPT